MIDARVRHAALDSLHVNIGCIDLAAACSQSNALTRLGALGVGIGHGRPGAVQDKVTTDGCTPEQNDRDETSSLRQFAIMRRDEPAEPLAAVGTEGVFAGESAPDAGTAYTGRPLEKGMCLSYWLQNVRCDPLLDHRTFDQQALDALPSEADVVIIGSGVSH